MSKNLADPTTLTIENAKWQGSGLNAIYAVTDTYVDVTIMMRWHTESAEAKCAVVYNARSYIILDDDTVVYSDPISDSVNAALAR